jgi:hypothetical protein
MSPLLWLVTYVVMVFLGGALLASPLYVLAQACAAGSAWAADLAAEPFHRYVSRSILALAVLGLYPLWRRLQIGGWRQLGLAKPVDWRGLGTGLLLGLGSLALLAAGALAAGVRHWHAGRSAAQCVALLGEATLSAIGAGALEEILFRGVLFGTLRKACHWTIAGLASSMFYALLHFFQKPQDPAEVHWFSGLQTLGAMLAGVTDGPTLLPGFAVLLGTGMVLSLAYQRQGTLYLPIGLHAGWILWLRLHRFLTVDPPGAASTWWGSRKMVDGWMVFVVMSAFVLLLWYWPQAKPAAPPRP